MKKRLLSLFLCAAVIFGIFPAVIANSTDTDLKIYADGTAVSEVRLATDGETKVSALLEQEGTLSGTYQWQIYAEHADLWANIVGKTDANLTLRFAMIRNLMDESTGTAKVRCRFTPVGAEEPMYSNELTVQAYEPTKVMAIDGDQQSPTPVVRNPGSVVIHSVPKETAPETTVPETTAPVETTVPETTVETTAETAVPETTAPVETTVPETTAETTAPETTEATKEMSLFSFLGLDAFVLKASAAEDDGSENVKQTYNIVINYQLESNEKVADPYTATLAQGEKFSATVTFPTVQGYLPYVNDKRQDAYEFNIESVSQDVTINVVYKPTNVNYTVIYYQQNVDNDLYTEVERETKQGLTNSLVPEVTKTYSGFYQLIYERPAIAADGSTVIEVYYDRNYYLMTFDMDGGYGTEPIYVRYGASIGTVANPTKAGYTFGGWSQTKGGAAVTLPTTMPAENKQYYAIWTANDTAKVTIVFWGENADDEEYSYLRSETVNQKPGEKYTYPGTGTSCPMGEHTHTNCEKVCPHTHTLNDCYSTTRGFKEIDADGLPDQIRNQDTTADGVYIYTSSSIFTTTTHYYLKLDGKWYTGSDWRGDSDDKQKISKTCTHVCGDSCYTCGKIAHTHSSECSGLWKFVESDTVTVAADGSSVVNVYYDRTEMTLTFKYNYYNRGYQSTDAITAKWGENISDAYNAIKTKANSNMWSADEDGGSPWTGYFGVMPQQSKTYYTRNEMGDSGYMTYYGESQTSGDYSVELMKDPVSSSNTVTDEDRYEFKGFTYDHGTDNGESCRDATFYYKRNSYTLTFNNGYKNVRTESVKYEAPLNTYSSYIPAVPAEIEAGSVEFAGWYLNPECTGNQYILSEHNMPAENVLLYAKWVPVTHRVQFSLDKEAYEKNELLTSHPTKEVHHGQMLSPTPAVPENGDYTFIGWFYEENGKEKAFDFANMEIRKDLHVYGKWSSNTLKQYTVQFVLKDGHNTKVADDITGSGLAGTTKTFDAKGGADLYTDYQEGHFPTVQSQSLLLDIEAEALTITFEYVEADAVPYTVNYLTKEMPADTSLGTVTIGGETYYKLAVSYTNAENRKAVVTEQFKVISGYMPDAYQKRLVVQVNADGTPATDKNVINFIYTKDTKHAYYKITHYTQNTDLTTWTEHASSQAIGDIGKTYTAEPMTIPGFTYDKTVEGTLTSGELTENGLELKLYYVRNEYPYQVRYLEQGTGAELAQRKSGTGKYGQMVSESAIDIDGYDKVDPTSAAISIRIETDNAARLNVITFYYTELEVRIDYVAVGPDGAQNFGSVDPTTETVKVKSGTAAGSTPIAGDGFKFVGWFQNEACTTPVEGEGWLVGNIIKPQKTDGKNTTATYYAKFEWDITDLTIQKEVSGQYDANERFIFTISGPDGYSNKVVVPANGSVTISGLKVGSQYTITEDTTWSWRYSTSSENNPITLTATKDSNIVMFTNTLQEDEWLTGDAYADNFFGGTK